MPRGDEVPTSTSRILSVDLTGYKAFRRITVPLRQSAYLVGPNNAGKSTIIEALRGVARMIEHAMRRRPEGGRRDKGRQVLAYPMTARQLGIQPENLRHEFAEEKETRIDVHFSKRGALHALWPAAEASEDGGAGFFYLEIDGQVPRRPMDVRAVFPGLGVVPTLAPLERNERILKGEYVREEVDGRRSSRHFRNHLHLLSLQNTPAGTTELADFMTFAAPWIPEIQVRGVESRFVHQPAELDLYIRETGSRTDREVCWAGDGMQAPHENLCTA